MGMLSQTIDISAVPEFFFCHNEMEDAGDGLIRIVRYIKRNGVIVPVCSTVSPALSVLKLGQQATDFARNMLMESSTLIGH